MITFSNVHRFEYMVPSGALAYDGWGWPWERPLVWMGIIQPKLFTVVTKTLTRHPREGNLRWYNPFSCVRLWNGDSAVNKVGLTNPGIDWWCQKIGPKVSRAKQALAGSIFGSRQELVQMAAMLNDSDLVGLEVNASCPNTGHPMNDAQLVIDDVKAVKEVSRHPVIVKVSVAQDYCLIVKQLEGVVEAVSLNSVPWEIVYPPDRTCIRSPLWRLEKKVGGGGGGVSGKLAQKYNWPAVRNLATQTSVPVIAPSIMEFEDLTRVRSLGAKAVSFGAIHLRTPWQPTQIVRKDMRCK